MTVRETERALHALGISKRLARHLAGRLDAATLAGMVGEVRPDADPCGADASDPPAGGTPAAPLRDVEAEPEAMRRVLQASGDLLTLFRSQTSDD